MPAPARSLLLASALVLSSWIPSPASSRTFQDDVGRRVEVPTPPHRIVSLAPSVTEILFDLGVGKSIVGVTDLCDDPPAARALPKVGGMVKPDWETIVGLRPDLVLATTSGNDASQVLQAENVAVPLYFTDAPDIESLLSSITRLAEVVGAKQVGVRLRQSLEERIRALRRAALSSPAPRVLFLVWVDPPVVPGSATFLDDALRLAGVESISSDAGRGWPTYDLETILRRRPEWIVAARHNASALAELTGKPGWRDLDAVRGGHLVTVGEAIERPSPRVVDAMEELQRLVRGEGKN